MRLSSFQVTAFRNVLDSAPIDVNDVTCLVGKNEAGKSAIMQALHVLNPANESSAMKLLDEYPRWLKKEHEITGEIDSAIPVQAIFELNDAEMDAVTARFGPEVLSKCEFRTYRTYVDPETLAIDANINERAFIDFFAKDLPERLQRSIDLAKIHSSEQLGEALEALEAEKGSEEPDAAATRTDAEEALKRLRTTLMRDDFSLHEAVADRFRMGLPRTFYFGSYSQLSGRYSLNTVLEAVDGHTADESVRAAADFLALARVDKQAIASGDYETSNSELESISNLLTRRVKMHWHQNDHLRLITRIEPETYSDTRGIQDVRNWLQFRVEDERHNFSNRLDRRSTGFRWFISFLAAFLEFEKDQNLILLLDEPGLSLHGRAQRDLLDAIETTLANNRQVIYSTHSPFMVRPDRLDRARLVEDKGPEVGATVNNEAGTVSDPDTLFPLEAALGYDIAETLFVGHRNILVEGISDFIYLTSLSTKLAKTGRTALPVDCRLLPAGGAANIPTFLALLGTQLDIVVLVDGSTSPQKIQQSIVQGKIKESRIIKIDQFSDVPGADIEDLFEVEEYLELYNTAFGKALKESDISGQDRIVKRIARKEGEFDHGIVATRFLRDLNSALEGLSERTLDRFENLIRAVATALPRAH